MAAVARADGEAGHTRSGDGGEVTIETGVDGGRRSQRRAAGPSVAPNERMGDLSMVMWPALTLIGFVLLTALVVAMGMQSTARYEQEQRSTTGTGSRQTAAETVGAIPA
jgi:hypothetical protein